MLALAAFLRLFRLGRVPNGFSPDEASYGYNGYSLLHTGRDRFGEWLPLFSDNFGDLISASYMWLTVPSIALFGLDEFAVRLPAALAGIAAVWVLYKLGATFCNERAGLLAALFLAISPWHIQISRYAERSPLLPLLFCAGLYFFLRWRQRAGNDLLWSALCFVLCLYTYAAARVFVPLFLVCTALLYIKPLLADKRRVLVSLALGFVLSLPALYHWTSPEGMARTHYLLHWTPLEWLANYVSYFNPDFLFFSGDANIRHSLRNVGQLHWMELATVTVGMAFSLLRRRRRDGLIFLWLLLYPIPAALTESGHAIRAVVGAPLFALFSGCGLAAAFSLVEGRRLRIAACVAALVLVGSVGLYGKRYFVDYAEYGAPRWTYGQREAFELIEERPYARVFLSNKMFLPHIFALFYAAYPPAEYQRNPLRSVKQGIWKYKHYRFGRYEVNAIGEITRRPCQNSALIALAGEARPFAAAKGWRRAKTIYVPDGRPALDVFVCP